MIPERIRVLTFIESASVTGPARVLIDFAQEARQPEPGLPAVDVTLITYRRGAGEGALATAAKAAGVPVIEVPELRRWDPGVIPQLRRAVLEFKPDILESRNVKSHFFIRLTGLHGQFPWIAWNHGYTSKDRRDRAYNQLDRWSLRGAFRVMTVCKPFSAAIQKLGVPAGKITILHNYVKPYAPPAAEEILRFKQELGLNHELVILTVGRMSSEKGHTDLLSAVALLEQVSGLPDYRVVLVGDGQEEENLRKQVANLGISGRIIMAGFQKNVAPCYATGTIFALPSHSEGSPNVVLEAMAAGLPIAATSVGGVPEILENEVNGLLVPARSPQALREAIRRLLVSPDLREKLASEARKKAAESHTLQAYKRELTRFYVETLQMREARQSASAV